MTGTVISEDAARLTLTNSTLGKLSVPLLQIERRSPGTQSVATVKSDSPPAVDASVQRQLDNVRDAYVTGLISVTEFQRQRLGILAQATPASTAATPVKKAPSPAGVVGPPIPAKPVTKLTGEAQAGLDLAFATKDRQLFSGRFKVQHIYSRLRNTGDYLFTYGRTEGQLSANRMDGTLKTDYDVTARNYAYNVGGAGYDEVRKLDNYFQVGPGAGWRALKLTNLMWNLEAGANFQEQNRTDGTQTDIFSYRLAEDGKWLVNSKFTLDQKLEFFAQVDDVQEYRLRFEANAKYWLRNNLSLNLTLIDLYDTMAARGVEANDLQIRSTIGVRF